MSPDIWDPVHFTPEDIEKAGIYLQDSSLWTDRRRETVYYPAKLFVRYNPAQSAGHSVIVADTGRGALTILSTSRVERNEGATLIVRLKDKHTRKLKGQISMNRPGKRADDFSKGKCKRFTARFKSVSANLA
jgi:hypothetical protein